MAEKKAKLNDQHLTELLKISEKACFAMSGFVQDVYKRLNEDRKLMKNKADNSFFTIADALVQVMVRIMFPAPSKFLEFCGEESSNNINIDRAPYSVDGMTLPEDLGKSFEKCLTEIRELAKQVDATKYKDIGVFVDPIDGTKEFCTGLGHQTSICIGFTKNMLPVAGIVFRPIPLEEGGKLTYMAGCASEGYKNGVLDMADGKAQESILTSNGSITKFTEALLKELDFVRYKAGGCGNKMLLLLEGKGTMYIQDRGVSRWDTCAAQAVIEACGGILCKLTTVEDAGKYESYNYKVGTKNLDLNSRAMLTKFNVLDKEILKQDPVPSVSADNVQPYSNVCGIFGAKDKDNKELLNKVVAAIQKVSKAVPPQYS
eukprot:CAMPEP_0184487332 /NCGR_PEP_ID=MMETSP0113_2-20130426/9780_1 /TAXON_ID=91329 /ORGANISM="Norrisiella sphaerica, Strain BC52" /LENGTH=372 /DNA_ID=CAMNT_0026869595 /DNA_START=88 /DNA_END=1206 /DNA_ORIENTATION=+